MKAPEIAALVNAHAGASPAILEALRSGSDAFCVSRSTAEARAFLDEAVRGGARSVLVGGGDGTLAHALTTVWGALDRDDDLLPSIGLLRLGTGNAAAEAFEAAPPTPDATRALLARLRERALGEPLRTLRVGDRLGCFAGFGVDAQLLEDHRVATSWLRGRGLGRLATGALGYVISTVTRSLPRFVLASRPTVSATSLGEPARPVDGTRIGAATLEAGASLWSGPCTLASCATIETFGFGLRMFAFAEADRDRFQVRLSDASLFEIVANTRAAFRGEYTSGRVHDFLADHVELRVSDAAPFELSGDLLGSYSRVEVRMGPTFELLV